MESQMERIVKMKCKIFVLFLVGIFLSSQNVFSEKEMDHDVAMNETNLNNQSSNQVLMYRMLNSETKNPADISYYRRWKKERKLGWLANHKNLLIPGMIDADTEPYE